MSRTRFLGRRHMVLMKRMGMFAYGREFVKPGRRSKPGGASKELSVTPGAGLGDHAAALLIASYNSSTAFSLVKTLSAPALSMASTW